jgi:hypothetical protein
MEKEVERNEGEKAAEQGGGNLRPQRGGEAATTRFGMEEGDNGDIPATGGPASEPS